jgi:hypothetical protein
MQKNVRETFLMPKERKNMGKHLPRERLYPHQRAFAEIRFALREGQSQAEEIEGYGETYGRGASYRDLLQRASEQHSVAQAA